MNFSRRIFLFASIWGALIIIPLYFLEQTINEQQPPPITHPEYYYGFAGVTLVWQILYFLISTNPIKYRTIMLLAILAKLSYGLAVPLLFVAGRVQNVVLVTSLPDLVWVMLFIIAYRKTPVVPGEADKQISHVETR